MLALLFIWLQTAQSLVKLTDKQEIPRFFLNLKAQDRIHRSPPLDPVPGHIIRFHILTHYFRTHLILSSNKYAPHRNIYQI
jgi:hypothetical protein